MTALLASLLLCTLPPESLEDQLEGVVEAGLCRDNKS
jgi:hypothetical protein